MKTFLLAAGLVAMASSAFAAGTPCDKVKDEIDAKIKANGATGYTLEVIDEGAPADGKKVVGTCEAGTKQIVYKR
ncbi:DUF1161 domain-containing protein [Pseudomonas typographi]|uniref:DUF1161 domain-containing protein n=1 Tax=Pseudomonas typographi TaxID=2715964 RepID=A0ABR7Z427_9PSED|nr:DUF1161 domain-containing protein [Pseudomonas typographi]MBD1552919.1 DUF1161 domain-containing protein [Pseudomonas typographi]MBD1588294.1 DUF1161 domain-containing protein [Pseudomonas typographi]MBD1600265.1 DUF1161 domain-containing protein [Pseudomonas typographi]